MLLRKKLTIIVLSLTILITCISSTASAKSVYVISNTETSHLEAYEVQGSNLAPQTDYYCQSDPSGDTGAVGLAIDPASQILFVTFEGENVIELVDTKTMEYVDAITVPGASNLANIINEP